MEHYVGINAARARLNYIREWQAVSLYVVEACFCGFLLQRIRSRVSYFSVGLRPLVALTG